MRVRLLSFGCFVFVVVLLLVLLLSMFLLKNKTCKRRPGGGGPWRAYVKFNKHRTSTLKNAAFKELAALYRALSAEERDKFVAMGAEQTLLHRVRRNLGSARVKLSKRGLAQAMRVDRVKQALHDHAGFADMPTESSLLGSSSVAVSDSSPWMFRAVSDSRIVSKIRNAEANTAEQSFLKWAKGAEAIGHRDRTLAALPSAAPFGTAFHPMPSCKDVSVLTWCCPVLSEVPRLVAMLQEKEHVAHAKLFCEDYAKMHRTHRACDQPDVEPTPARPCSARKTEHAPRA